MSIQLVKKLWPVMNLASYIMFIFLFGYILIKPNAIIGSAEDVTEGAVQAAIVYGCTRVLITCHKTLTEVWRK